MIDLEVCQDLKKSSIAFNTSLMTSDKSEELSYLALCTRILFQQKNYQLIVIF